MYTTGTASGHIDLLEKVRDYLVNTVGWTELNYDGTASPSPVDDTATVNLSLRAPGASSGNEYFLNVRTEADTGTQSYGWRMSAAQDWDTGLEDMAQMGASEYVYFNTWENSMDFWLYANDRRFVLVVKCNTSYISMYAGLILPFALPNEYLRPFCICGNSYLLEPYNVANSRNQFIANPGYQACWVLNYAADTWLEIKNTDESSASVKINAAKDGVVWPHRSLRQFGDADQGSGQVGDWNYNGFHLVRPNLNGESPQFLCHILCNAEDWMLGTFDGVYATAGFDRTSEQELTYDTKTYRVFQNIFRTTPRDFMSILEN